MLDFRSGGPGSSPGRRRDHCVVFLGYSIKRGQGGGGGGGGGVEML